MVARNGTLSKLDFPISTRDVSTDLGNNRLNTVAVAQLYYNTAVSIKLYDDPCRSHVNFLSN